MLNISFVHIASITPDIKGYIVDIDLGEFYAGKHYRLCEGHVIPVFNLEVVITVFILYRSRINKVQKLSTQICII